MNMKFATLGLALVFTSLAACAPDATTEPAVETPEVETPEAEAPTPPPPMRFFEAQQTYQTLGTVTGAQSPAPIPRGETTDRLAEAVAYVESMESYAFIVWQGGEIVHEQYFAPHTSELRSESASMHKSVLALVVGAAIADGHIASTQEPVSTYIPEWRDDPRGAITIENLLQMNTGLKPLSYEGGAEAEANKFNSGENVEATILGLELVAEPNSVFHYANTASQLLGIIVERTSGLPYEDYLAQRIWGPMGAGDAYVYYNEVDRLPRTYSALLARAEDWLRVGLLIKDGGMVNGEQIIPADYIEAMTSPSSTNPNYGYQVWLGTEFDPARFYNDAKTGFAVTSSEPFATDDMIYFDGFGGQRVYISASQDLVIIRMGDVRFDWDDAKLPNLVIAALGEQ